MKLTHCFMQIVIGTISSDYMQFYVRDFGQCMTELK